MAAESAVDNNCHLIFIGEKYVDIIYTLGDLLQNPTSSLLYVHYDIIICVVASSIGTSKPSILYV